MNFNDILNGFHSMDEWCILMVLQSNMSFNCESPLNAEKVEVNSSDACTIGKNILNT